MKFIVRIVALSVVAFLFATPLMACAMETASLTVSETECCKAMKGECHNSVGPASHRCCRTIAAVPDASKPARSAALSQPQVGDLIVPAIVPATTTATASTIASASSPPGSPPVLHTILRI